METPPPPQHEYQFLMSWGDVKVGMCGASSYLAHFPYPWQLQPQFQRANCLSSSLYFPSMYSAKIYWAPAKRSVRLWEHQDIEHMVPNLEKLGCLETGTVDSLDDGNAP